MLKKIAMAALAAGALAFNAPIAQAAEPTSVDCGFNSVAQETATGGQDTFTGAAYGYIVGAAGETSVSVKCVVKVNGSGVAETTVGTGTVAATSQGQVTYTATDQDDVDLCAVWTTSTSSGEVCGDATTTQIPPQVVIDLITLITSIPDPLICPVLGTLSPGVPGVVDITPQGDITLLDPIGPFWDCPPYDA